ncbi:MAG: hypothetical protein LBJ89_03440 [Holosporales bacterium]|jgi:hypothetical protein|nr:hypothetical protein [Holosporales bacterium]
MNKLFESMLSTVCFCFSMNASSNSQADDLVVYPNPAAGAQVDIYARSSLCQCGHNRIEDMHTISGKDEYLREIQYTINDLNLIYNTEPSPEQPWTSPAGVVNCAGRLLDLFRIDGRFLREQAEVAEMYSVMLRVLELAQEKYGQADHGEMDPLDLIKFKSVRSYASTLAIYARLMLRAIR